jgi:hypothetical protein
MYTCCVVFMKLRMQSSVYLPHEIRTLNPLFQHFVYSEKL